LPPFWPRWTWFRPRNWGRAGPVPVSKTTLDMRARIGRILGASTRWIWMDLSARRRRRRWSRCRTA
jgi:hypothetical protein